VLWRVANPEISILLRCLENLTCEKEVV